MTSVVLQLIMKRWKLVWSQVTSLLTNFLKLIKDYGTCSGLKVNHEKSEVLLVCNRAYEVEETHLNNIKIKRSVKNRGKHFIYNIREKSIQIVKTPYYPYLLISHKLDKFVKEASKIIFDFIWKGKDKNKRSALISDIEDGGLKASYLNSIIIETQKVLCCKKLENDQPSGWKTILLHYLKPVGVN